MDKARILSNLSWSTKLRRSNSRHSKAGRRKEIAFPPPLPVESTDYSSATETEPFPTLQGSDFQLAMQHFADAPEDTYEPVSGFWQKLDRKLSAGGEDTMTRGIDQSMVDGVDGDGWRETCREFSDALSGDMHPVVAAFVAAQSSNSIVVLGAEHIWLMVLQALSAVVKTGHGEFAAGGNDKLWKELRKSSGVPARLTDTSERECRLFASHMDGYHPLYTSNGAAPIVMAAAVAGHVHTGRVEYGRMESSGSIQNVMMRKPRGIGRGARRSIRGLQLVGTIQAWSALCMMTRQLKETYAGQGIDWWLYRAHKVCGDLTNYFAAQFEFIDNEPTRRWRQWTLQALETTPGRFDGWLASLFSVDNTGTAIHTDKKFGMEWTRVPSGVDVQRVAVTRDSWQNLYSGFVGQQRMIRARVANRSGTLHGDDEFPAIVVRDCASTLTESDDTGFEEGEAGIECAVAPVIGWALDRQL